MTHVQRLPEQGIPPGLSVDEWNARTDLAAAHRLAGVFGWTNLIYNHFTLRVPHEPEHFLVKPHELMFEEVTASSLVKVDLNGNAVGWDGNLNAAGFSIHTAVLRARPDVNSVVHVHTNAGMAMSAHAVGLRFITQGAMRFYNRISYHPYEGIAGDLDERDRIARNLGKNKAMIMNNHGLLTCGTTIRESVVLMKYLIAACSTQLMLEATGAGMIEPSPEVCEHAARQWDEYDRVGGSAEWPALLRMLDRQDPSFRQ